MGDRMVSRADAKMIAETCGDLADKVLHWKERALAAEEGLRKFASEIYQPRVEDARLREALEEMCAAAEYWAGCDEGCSPDEASSEIMSSGGAMPSLAYDKAHAALQGDAAHTSQEKGG